MLKHDAPHCVTSVLLCPMLHYVLCYALLCYVAKGSSRCGELRRQKGKAMPTETRLPLHTLNCSAGKKGLGFRDSDVSGKDGIPVEMAPEARNVPGHVRVRREPRFSADLVWLLRRFFEGPLGPRASCSENHVFPDSCFDQGSLIFVPAQVRDCGAVCHLVQLACFSEAC